MDKEIKQETGEGRPAALNSEPGGKTRPRVMVADDENNIRRALWYILKNDFDVTVVENGDKALDQVRQGHDFDVVSLDIQMPGMSGIETLQAIKAERPDIEVLLVTAHSNAESAKKALKLGAYDYIDKPFNNEDIRAAVRRGVERRKKVMTSEAARGKIEFFKAQLLQTEKFTAIGQLLAGVVHELNNPLGVIMGYSELLLQTGCATEKVPKYLENIHRSAGLCKSIVEKLLLFARKHEPKKEPIQVNDVIESTLDLKQHDFKIHDIRLQKHLAGDLPVTLADFHELQQVFLNLATNAQHAMMDNERQKELTVSSSFEDKVLRVKFHDTGHGIPQENLDKIFEPLFTTKEKGKGTGLGLSVCYEIIKDHGGDIFVASEPGKGSWFIVEIPLVQKKPNPAPATA
ncbi:MAG: response regulator [Pseudomonadota bacterium]